MEVRCTGSESSKYGSLDFTYMIEIAVDQSLSEVCRRLTIIGRRAIGRVNLASRYFREVADVQAAQVNGAIRWIGVAGTDIQRCGKRMISHVRRIVAGAAGALKDGNASGH